MLYKKFLCAIASLFLTPLCVWLALPYLEPFSGVVRIGGLILAGFAAGAIQGQLFGKALYRIIGFGAFFGLLVLWVPLVIVTYGFALFGVPLLMAYAACVAIGARYGPVLLRRSAPSS